MQKLNVKLNCRLASAFRIKQWDGLQEKVFVYKMAPSESSEDLPLI
jgi:hypothetical protein